MINISSTLKKKIKKQFPTSKVILIILLFYIALLTPPTLYLAFQGYTTPLEHTIQGAFTLSSIAVGFYYWKAKAENLHKYKQNENITMNGE